MHRSVQHSAFSHNWFEQLIGEGPPYVTETRVGRRVFRADMQTFLIVHAHTYGSWNEIKILAVAL
jgi:hypothetical protein